MGPGGALKRLNNSTIISMRSRVRREAMTWPNEDVTTAVGAYLGNLRAEEEATAWAARQETIPAFDAANARVGPINATSAQLRRNLYNALGQDVPPVYPCTY